MRRTTMSVGGTIAIPLLAVALSWPAYAVSWGTLTVNEDGKQQGRGYGSYGNHRQTHARNNAWYIDNKPGGDPIFVDTRHLFSYSNCSSGDCAGKYYEDGHDQSPRNSTGDWAYDEAYETLNVKANSARGQIKVCEDHSGAKDPCSFTALPTFNY